MKLSVNGRGSRNITIYLGKRNKPTLPTTAPEWLAYHGYKGINVVHTKTIPAGYDYGDVEVRYKTFPLAEAITWNTNLDLIKSLLDNGADVNLRADTGPVIRNVLLEMGCNERSFKLVKLFVDRGANVNLPTVDGDYPLHEAAYNWDGDCALSIITYLLEHGANPNKKNGEFKTPADCIIESHQWQQRKHLPFPIDLINLLEHYSGKYDDTNRH